MLLESSSLIFLIKKINILQSYKYQEEYQKALEEFHAASQLDPSWTDPATEEKALLTYLDNVVALTQQRVRTACCLPLTERAVLSEDLLALHCIHKFTKLNRNTVLFA